jgi:hypothetical protein
MQRMTPHAVGARPVLQPALQAAVQPALQPALQCGNAL